MLGTSPGYTSCFRQFGLARGTAIVEGHNLWVPLLGIKWALMAWQGAEGWGTGVSLLVAGQGHINVAAGFKRHIDGMNPHECHAGTTLVGLLHIQWACLGTSVLSGAGVCAQTLLLSAVGGCKQ